MEFGLRPPIKLGLIFVFYFFFYSQTKELSLLKIALTSFKSMHTYTEFSA